VSFKDLTSISKESLNFLMKKLPTADKFNYRLEGDSIREARPSAKSGLQAMMDRAISKQRISSSFARPTMQQSLSIIKTPRKPLPITREPTILGKFNSLTNFDNLGMRNQSNKFYVKLNAVLAKYGENMNPRQVFTEQIMQIDSKMNKTKRLLVVTEQSLFCLRENFSTKLRLELKNIAKVFLIKSNSSVLALS
jgi:hypothetical protein